MHIHSHSGTQADGHSHDGPNYNFLLSHKRWAMLIGISLLGVIGGLVLFFVLRSANPTLAFIVLGVGVGLGALVLVALAIMLGWILSNRTKVIDQIAWRGDEQVLDVGCGNGILAIAAAKHLTTGQSIGIDYWDEHAGMQEKSVAERNARAEGVAGRVEFQTADARDLPFPDSQFDVIVTSLALHHIGEVERTDVDKAVNEMLRVLKPGGRVVIYDVAAFANRAADVMRRAGMKDVGRVAGAHMFPIVLGVKEGPA